MKVSKPAVARQQPVEGEVSLNLRAHLRSSVCVRVYVCVCVCVRMHEFVRECECECMRVCAGMGVRVGTGGIPWRPLFRGRWGRRRQRCRASGSESENKRNKSAPYCRSAAIIIR